MQGLVRALKNQAYSGRGSTLKHTKVLSFKSSQHPQGINDATVAQSNSLPEKGLHNTTVAQVMLTKGEEKVGSWLWCRTDDSVYDAVKQKKFLRDIPIHSKIYMQGIEDKKVIHLLAQGLIYPYEIFFASLVFWPEKPLHKLQIAQNNIGSLVVLKPGEQQLIAGIFTERDYLRKVIVHDRSSKYTKVGEIMTDQDKLISVSSDTNVLHAMQLMTENQIRHAPVIDGKIVGMISIVDVVRAVLDQQHEEMKRQKWPYQRRLLLEHRFVHQA